MTALATREALGAWLRTRTRAELEHMARERDVPLLTLEA
jgi:hypothetical protein